MKVRVGLMGFGRVGRNIFRILARRDDIEVVAISDLADAPSLEYLLKYDTILGRYPDPVSLKDSILHVGGKQVRVFSGPGDVAWGDVGVDVVIEATGRQRSRAEVSKHLTAGAKRVISCVPMSDESDITVIMGINQRDITSKHRIISSSSMTTHCAVPIVKILEQAFGVERIYYTSVHAYTSDQRLADVPADDMRRSRAASENIIPVEADAGEQIAKFVPSLKGKISGMSLKVPVVNGSLVDMVTFTKKPVTVQAVNDAVRTAVEADYKRIVEYTADPIVSSDIKQSPFSSTFDSLATMVLGNQTTVKTIAWYDNGWGYAHRAVELVEHLAKMEGGLS